MNKFDNLIMDAMINVDSMLMARHKVLVSKMNAGHDVSQEMLRAKRFQQRYATFVRDWQYWYYDDIAGQGDAGPGQDRRLQKGTEVQLGLNAPVGQGDRQMPRKKRK